MGHGRVAQSGLYVQLMLKWTKRTKKKLIFWRGNGSGREGVRGERKLLPSLYDLQRLGSRNLSSQFKVHLLDEGYAWVPTTRSFTEDFWFGEENIMREALLSL